jgi:ribosomal protein S18 acetylase RimI-like enzyme
MVTIRLIQQTDWKALHALIEPVDKQLVGMNTKTEELVEDWINTLDMGVWEVYVAISKSDKKRKQVPLLGVVTLYGDWEFEEDIEQGEFDIGITVSEKYQRRGIGKRLLDFIINRGKELNYVKATLWTRVDNTPMIKLAQKLGFHPSKTRFRHGFNWQQYILEIKKEEEE